MKKITLFALIGSLFVSCVSSGSLAQEFSWEDIGREMRGLNTLLVDPAEPDNIYAGADSGIFKTDDGGGSWRRVISLRGQNRGINSLCFGPAGAAHLYAATGSGLFYSIDRGESWKRIYRGKGYLQNECTCVLVLPEIICLGTKGGLFMSKDNGRSWYRDKGEPGSKHIIALDYNAKEPAYIYAASVNGVFTSRNNGESWEKGFTMSETHEDAAETEEPADEAEAENGAPQIRDIACDPVRAGCVYAATSRGIYMSCNNGVDWELFPAYGLLSRDTAFLAFSNKGELNSVSRSGIFKYADGRWQELSLGLTAGGIRSLVFDSRDNLYAACDNGLFKAIRVDHGAGEDIISTYSRDEPQIREIQEAAIQYAEVEPGKIKRWRKLAGRKAILPKVTVGLDRSATDLWHWESGSSTKTEDDILRKGRDSIEWDVSLSWDLGELIWNGDQTSIDVRSKLMVQLRDDILDEVTKLYFERIRVKMELDRLAIEDRKKRFDKELKLRELTASIDALTGGYFSSHLP